MARENCPGCEKEKHVLNRCSACGFQRLKLHSNNHYKPSKSARRLETKISTTNASRQNKNQRRRKTSSSNKYRCAGSIMQGLVYKTASRQWHHVK